MNLNKGLTKIIKEYPSIRVYSNMKQKKETGRINLEMEDKVNEYSNFLKDFNESIQEFVSKNFDVDYKIDYSDLAQGADVPHIAIFNENYPNYHISYLFRPDGKGVYLCLNLSLEQFKSTKSNFNKNDLDKIRKTANTFRNNMKTINENDTENNLDFTNFNTACNMESSRDLAKAYNASTIYSRYYKLQEDKNIFLPPESKLEKELIEFLKLYQYFSNYDYYFCKDKIVKPKDIIITNKVYKSFYDYLMGNGFYFDKETIENYLLSLKVKPFVILTGNSGTGKTKLSQLLAKYLNDKDNYKIIPVGANWTENRHILGYFNIIKNKPQYTPAYYLIKHSQDNQYPHFLILDEMNLSHVERYFADFLSAIESNENIPMQGKNELKIPSNLFIIGTVNLDETTYMFSPKVLDRANTIEFKTYPANNYMTNKFDDEAPQGNIKYLKDVLSDLEIREMSIQDLEKVFDNDEFWNELSNEIFKFQEILKEANFDFGFRVINEITCFMAVAYKYENKPENWTNWKRYFDAQIKQKMLPKIHGSQKLIGETLDKLLEACEDYPTSKAKIIEMQNVLNKQRYVSFIN